MKEKFDYDKAIGEMIQSMLIFHILSGVIVYLSWSFAIKDLLEARKFEAILIFLPHTGLALFIFIGSGILVLKNLLEEIVYYLKRML